MLLFHNHARFVSAHKGKKKTTPEKENQPHSKYSETRFGLKDDCWKVVFLLSSVSSASWHTHTKRLEAQMFFFVPKNLGQLLKV